MTTLKALCRLAGPYFDPLLLPTGFSEHSSLAYARERNGIHDVVLCRVLSSGSNLRVMPFVWVKEFDFEGTATYPPIGMPTRFPSWESTEWTGTWGVGSDDEARLSLERIANLLRSEVLPWFDSITNGELVLKYLDPNLQGSSRVEAVKADIISNYRGK